MLYAAFTCPNFHFQSLAYFSSMPSLSESLFVQDPYSNEYLVAKSVFDTADNESSEVCQEFDSYTD